MIPNLGCYVCKKSLGMHHCPFRIHMCTCKFISMTIGLYIVFLSFQKRQYHHLWNLLITESMVFRLPLMYHSKWNIDTTSSIIQIICIPLALYLNIITKPSTFNAIRILLRYYSVDIRTILHWLSQFVLCKRCERALFVLTANNVN